MSRLQRFIGLQMLGQIGDAVLSLTLAQVVVFDLHDGLDPTSLSRVLLAAAIPYAVIGPIAARVADGRSRHRRLAITSLIRSMLAWAPLLVLWTADSTVGYVAGSLLLTAGGVAATLRWAAIPHVVGATRLVTANSACSLGQRAAGAIGAGTGTALLFVSPLAAVIVGAALHGLAALGYATFPTSLGGGPTASHRPRSGKALREGIDCLLRTRSTRPLYLALLIQRGAYGAAFVTFLLVMDQRWDLDASNLVVLMALAASGTTLAGLISAPVTKALGYRWPSVLAFVVPAVGLAAASMYLTPWLTVSSVALASLGFQLVRLITDSSIHRFLHEGVRGRAFAGYDLTSQVAYLVGGLTALALPGRATPTMFAWVAVVYGLGVMLPLQIVGRSSPDAQEAEVEMVAVAA